MRRRATAVLAASLALGLAGCSSTSYHGKPAAAPAVALDAAVRLAAPLTIGLVVTRATAEPLSCVDSSCAGPEGSGDDPLAAGAELAAYRLSRQGRGVTLDVVDDQGTAAGAKAAVQKLVADGVAGIVEATQGAHVLPGLSVASAAHVPVLLPYATSAGVGTAAAPNGVWFTGPSDAELLQQVTRTLDKDGSAVTDVVTDASAAGVAAALTSPQRRVTLTGHEDAAQLARALQPLTSAATPATRALVWTSGAQMAQVVAALEGARVTSFVLGPDALSPTFGDTLALLHASSKNPGQGTTLGDFLTVGVDATDATTSAGMAGFLTALHVAAQDQRTTTAVTLPTALCFSAAGAATADSRSHDAVVALAAAAAAARSSAPAAVLAALQHLTVTAKQGIAGPALDFSSGPDAVAPTDVVLLQGTPQTDSARSSYGTCVDGSTAAGSGDVDYFSPPALQWFAVPTS